MLAALSSPAARATATNRSHVRACTSVAGGAVRPASAPARRGPAPAPATATAAPPALLAQPPAAMTAEPKTSQKKTVVITGASSGLGLAAAKALAAGGDWHVVMAVRDFSKAEAAAKKLGFPQVTRDWRRRGRADG